MWKYIKQKNSSPVTPKDTNSTVMNYNESEVVIKNELKCVIERMFNQQK